MIDARPSIASKPETSAIKAACAPGSRVSSCHSALNHTSFPRRHHAATCRRASARPRNRTKYAYDSSGRRISKGGSLATTELPAAVTGISYNANNQLTSWAGTPIAYDLNGNMTSDGTNAYSWNSRNELTAITGGAAASFVYDAVGRRRSKTIGGVQTSFLYDGQNFVQELTGAGVKANLVTGGLDEVFLRREGAIARHFLSDALGSVVALTDTTGALQTQYSFEPYGVVATTGAADANSQKYAAREDDNTGLYYYRARYFAPGIARFIGEDPIGWNSGQTNDYAYVGGNPLSHTDPTGEAVPVLAACIVCPQCCVVVGVAVVGICIAENNKATRKKISGLEAQIADHEKKIQNEPDCDAVCHWKKEIKAWKDRIDRLKKRLPGGS